MNLVRRKIRASGTDAADGGEVRAARVWQQAGARALKAAVGMNAQVTGVETRAVEPDDLPGLPEEHDLVALMENDDGRFGLALVSAGVLASVVEMQTIGRVTDRAVRPRRPTAVDGALIGPAIDRLLSGADAALAGVGARDPVTDYRYAMLAEAGAPPTLSLGDVPHKVLRLEFRVDGGRRTGTIRFVTPEEPPPASAANPGGEDWAQRIGEAVLASDVTLDARLGKVQMPVEKVLDLRAGDTLPFSREDLQQVRLVCSSGHVLARARLGQSCGFRAVKLNVELPQGLQPGLSPPTGKEPAEKEPGEEEPVDPG